MTQSREVKGTVPEPTDEPIELTPLERAIFEEFYDTYGNLRGLIECGIDHRCDDYLWEILYYIMVKSKSFDKYHLWLKDCMEMEAAVMATIDEPHQPAKDKYGNRYAKCTMCGKIDIVDNFVVYGVSGHCNRGKCMDCIKQYGNIVYIE